MSHIWENSLLFLSLKVILKIEWSVFQTPDCVHIAKFLNTQMHSIKRSDVSKSSVRENTTDSEKGLIFRRPYKGIARFSIRLYWFWKYVTAFCWKNTKSFKKSTRKEQWENGVCEQCVFYMEIAMDLAYMCVKHQMRLYVCQALSPPKHQMRLYVCHQMRLYVCHQMRLYVCHQMRLYVCHQMCLLTQRNSLRSLTFARFARTFFNSLN